MIPVVFSAEHRGIIAVSRTQALGFSKGKEPRWHRTNKAVSKAAKTKTKAANKAKAAA
jgi:hypothetical protein